jgi:hypothetical protein
MLFSTSLAKKNLPSEGTIVICSLSDSFSATILLYDLPRILLQDCASCSACVHVGNRGDANAVGFGTRKHLAALHLDACVDDFGFGLGCARSSPWRPCGPRPRAGLLDLLLLERESVLHSVGFGLGLKHLHLSVAFGLLHLLDFGAFGFEFRNPDLFFLNLGLHAHLVVLLFLQQQAFEALGVFRRKLDVASLL